MAELLAREAMRRLAAALALVLPLAAAEPDVLDALLSRGGMARADLGARGPTRRAPFEMPHVERVHADPLSLPLLGDRFRTDVERHGGDAAALLLAGTIAPRLSGVANVALPEEDDLARALARLRRPTAEDETPDEADLADAERLAVGLRRPVARLLFALAAADAQVRAAWAGVDPDMARRAAREERLVPELADGARLFREVENAVRGLDARSLAEAGLIAVAACERAARELKGAGRVGPRRWEVATARGKVRVAGPKRDAHDAAEGPFLAIVDLGGSDRYEGSLAAGTWPAQAVSVVVDAGGDDEYEAGDAAQGAGLGGVGVLHDAEGNDRYRARSRAQGFAQLGAGVLVDESGRDEYVLEEAGQGSAVFGSGLLLDRKGRDRYTVSHDGQGFGGPGGVGLLADLEGSDRYEAVREAARAGRPDPRSEGKAATSNAQGVGLGRRGSLDEGHAWGGGLGALVDLQGDDIYSGGTWCQGAGYWFGTGVLVDAAGDDRYEAVWYAQGSAAHRALGLLLDRAGKDRYALVGTGGAGLGFGWDLSAGVFIDLAGNDEYRAVRLALGAAMQRSFALFLDARGDDDYDASRPDEVLGFVDEDPRWRERDESAPGWFEGSQAGLFLDLGGRDRYPAGRGANGAMWGSWKPERRTSAPRNLAGAVDVDAPLPAPLDAVAER